MLNVLEDFIYECKVYLKVLTFMRLSWYCHKCFMDEG